MATIQTDKMWALQLNAHKSPRCNQEINKWLNEKDNAIALIQEPAQHKGQRIRTTTLSEWWYNQKRRCSIGSNYPEYKTGNIPTPTRYIKVYLLNNRGSDFQWSQFLVDYVDVLKCIKNVFLLAKQTFDPISSETGFLLDAVYVLKFIKNVFYLLNKR